MVNKNAKSGLRIPASFGLEEEREFFLQTISSNKKKPAISQDKSVNGVRVFTSEQLAAIGLNLGDSFVLKVSETKEIVVEVKELRSLAN